MSTAPLNAFATAGSKTYMITFYAPGADVSGFEGFVKFDRRVLAYWNYMPFVYCIRSVLSARDIALAVQSFFPSGNYIIAEIDPTNLDGKLPREAWEWFYGGSVNRLMRP